MWIGKAWTWLTAWPRGFLNWAHLAVCALTTEDGRKGWAMLAALGCSFVMTAYAVIVLFLVRKNPMLTFWLGLSALVIVTVVITGLMVLLGVKRKTNINLKDGTISMDDQGNVTVTPAPPPPVAPVP